MKKDMKEYFKMDRFERRQLEMKNDPDMIRLNDTIIEIRNFLDNLSYGALGRDMVVLRNTAGINCNGILLSAVQTLESVRLCCGNCNFADAFTLLRKYRDDVFYYLYVQVVTRSADLGKDFDKTPRNKDEKKIFNWLHDQQEDLNINLVLKKIGMSEKVAPAIAKYHLKESFAEIGVRLNNFVHSNGVSFYNKLYTHYKADDSLSKICEELENIIEYITVSFVFIAVLVNPAIVMSEDYIEYLESGQTPPEDSQYWIYPFVETYFSKHKHCLDDKCNEYLKENTGMFF